LSGRAHCAILAPLGQLDRARGPACRERDLRDDDPRQVAIEENIPLPVHPGSAPGDECREMISSFLGYLPSVQMLPRLNIRTEVLPKLKFNGVEGTQAYLSFHAFEFPCFSKHRSPGDVQ
jgi:hypothetical protein